MPGETMKYIQFYNTTDLPVLIDAWNTPAYSSVSKLTTTRIEPFESKIVHSSVGEWHMNAMFYNEADNSAWKGRGLGKYDTSIGKFRSDPCAMGNYSWMEYKHFMCEYTDFQTDEDSRVKGKITFSISKELCFTHS